MANVQKNNDHLKTSNIRQNNLKNRYKTEQYKSTKDRGKYQPPYLLSMIQKNNF